MMMSGKRPRPLVRTTSMTGINMDLDQSDSPSVGGGGDLASGGGPMIEQSLMGMVSPRQQHHRRRRSSHNYGQPDPLAGNTNCLETAHFLRTCGLCHRRLAPGRDIYMFRGDTAFCSLECREQQIKYEERKENCSSMMASNSDLIDECHRRHSHQNRHSASAASSESSGQTETVAAA